MKNLFTELKNNLFIYLALAGLTLVASQPLFIDGWFWTHEQFDPVGRIIAISQEICSGDFYPRWLSYSYRGKGSPFFNFYSPFFHFSASYLHVAGLSLLASIKLTLGLLFFAGATGVYLWSRRHYGKYGGAIAAVLYLFAPYHFVDIYVRGAFAEFSALAILPYLFLGIELVIDEPDHRIGFFFTVLATSLILISHQLSAIMIAPFAVLYSLGRLFSGEFSSKKLLTLMGIPFVAAGLSAFYWLPVIFEKQYLRDFAGAVLHGENSEYNYSDHFVLPFQLVSNLWGFGTSVKGPADGMSFQLGILLVILATLSIVFVRWIPQKVRKFQFLVIALGLSGLFLTSEYSETVYRLVPPLAYIQFPWRFLGLTTLFLAAAGGAIGAALNSERIQFAILALLIVLSVFFSGRQRAVNLPNLPISPAYEKTQVAMRSLGSLNLENEYLPKWAPKSTITAAPEVAPLADSGVVKDVVAGTGEISFAYFGNNPESMVTIPWYFFPGWKAMIDGRPVTVNPGRNGYIAIRVPSGRHNVKLLFGTTWPRAIGWTLALLTFAAMSFWFLKGHFRSRE